MVIARLFQRLSLAIIESQEQSNYFITPGIEGVWSCVNLNIHNKQIILPKGVTQNKQTVQSSSVLINSLSVEGSYKHND